MLEVPISTVLSVANKRFPENLLVPEAVRAFSDEPTVEDANSCPTTVRDDVTVELAPIKPPYKSSVEVAKEPRAVTVASVSLSVMRYAGQLVASSRQTETPPTVRAPNSPAFAFNCVVEATPETYKFVVVTLVAVAFVAVMFCKFVSPRTVNVEVTVEEAVRKPP